MTVKNFFYHGRISLSLDVFKDTVFTEVFTDAYESVFYSNPVNSYKQVIKESASLINEVVEQLKHGSGHTFLILWEANPLLSPDKHLVSKTENITKWTPTELVRFFIADEEDIKSQNEALVIPMLLSICHLDADPFALNPPTGTIH